MAGRGSGDSAARLDFYFQSDLGRRLTGGVPYPVPMASPSASNDGQPAWPVRWLRLAKLVLTVILLALAVWNAAAGALH